MGTLHKRTHRPLARRWPLALFLMLGVIGWQLPGAGASALSYGTQAYQSVRGALGRTISSLTGSERKVSPPGLSAKILAAAQDSGLTLEQAKLLNELYGQTLYSDEFAKEELYVLGRFHDGAEVKPLEADTVLSRVLYNTYVSKRGVSRAQDKLLRDYKALVTRAGRQVLDEGDPSPKGKAPGGSGANLKQAPAHKSGPASPSAAITSAFSEGFDDITTLAGAGWSLQNLSNPVGTTGWFQGNDAVFPSQAGATTAYIGANFNNVSNVGNISNWLLTPEIGLKNGDQIKFWTRKVSPDSFADRLQVRMSTAGASTNVGASDTSVGDFTTVLLDINPTLVLGVYPVVYTQFTVTISGLGAATTGRIGFRYFVTNGGLNGANSDYIGIDTFEYAPLLSQAVISGVSATLTAESCAPANNVPDPGETVTISMCLKNTGATAAANVVATLPQNPAGGILNPSGPQSYGAIPNNGTPVCRSFTFTVPSSTVCGGTVMPSFTIADNGVPLSPVNFTLGVGTTNAPMTTSTFTQNTPITISTAAPPNPATPYPSTINVAGVTGTVTGIKVNLNGTNHTFTGDLDIMLVGPTGAAVVLMSDAGSSADLVNTNLTFVDGAPYVQNGSTPAVIPSGNYSPTNYGAGDAFSAPAPTAPIGGPLNTTFGGLNPNGTWSLYVMDDASGDGGSITSWSIELTTTSVTPTVTTTPFTNAASIAFPADPPGSGNATPYPSTINVSGLSGTIQNIVVSLNGVNHTFPSDMDFLLVGPTGVGYVLLSDIGGGTDAVNATLTIQDGAAMLPASLAASQTLGPSNSGTGDTFPAPAPGTFQNAPSAGQASILGTYGSLNPNGTWSLYAVDDLGGDTGAISGGWTISFTTVNFPTSCSTCPTCTLTPPANITVPAEAGACSAVVTYSAPGTSGTCGAVTCTPASGATFPKGTTTVSCVSASGGGFTSFTVTVNDTQAPVITCPANITTNTITDTCAATVTYSLPTVTDNCPGVGTPVCTPPSGSSFAKGVTTVNCTVTDASGNPASCAFTVTVNDLQAPAITCPANIFAATTGTTQVVTYALPAVSDNCPGVQTPVCTPASGFAFPVGVTTVNCSVKDAANNTSTCSFAVTVNKVVVPALSDPLACTGPGNVVSGSFSASNNGAVNQTVAATVTLGPSVPFQQLLALPGTCVVTPNIGTCTVVNGSTITYNATLGAGQSVMVSYKLQVADGVQPGVTLTSTVVASFNGGPPLTAGASLLSNCQTPGPGPFYPARSEVTDQKAGSVLVYPVYTSSVADPKQNSRLSITNTHPNLPGFVHLFFVADNCSVSDAFICLTPNQTTTFQASDLDPGTTGYLVAVASSGVTGCPVNFNYLIGDEYVKFASGHAANLGAEAISAIAGSGFWASCNNNSVSAVLAFDGVSYNRLPYVVAVDSIGSRADGNDTMLVLDRIGGDLRTGPSGLGAVFGVFYNDAEASLSFTLNSASCQFRFIVNNTVPRITPRFDQFVTAGRSGWMRLYQRDGAAMLGSVINFNANAGTNAGAFNQGHNLHHLTLTDTASYIIPVFPPSC